VRIRILVFLFFSLSGWALADPAVGRVESLHGNKKLYRQEAAQGKKYLSHIEEHAQVRDRFITDSGSMASILFFLGGNISMGKDCEIEIVNDREAKVLRQGNYWVKFDPNRLQGQDKTVKIQTAGGVMGIRGTEFVLRVQGEGDEQTTELSLIEGVVDVETNDGKRYLARSEDEDSTRVRFGGGSEILHTLLSRQELLGNLREELGPEFEELRSSVREFRKAYREAQIAIRLANAEQKRAFLSARAGALQGADALRDAEAVSGLDMQALRDQLARASTQLEDDPEQETTPAETTALDDDVLSALLRGEAALDDEPPVDPDSPIAPEEVKGHPSMTWAGSPQQKYAVLILDPDDKDQVYWVADTVGPSFTHPKEAKPLRPGKYVFRVIPVDSDGELKQATDYEILVND
jgi:FecR-like protein